MMLDTTQKISLKSAADYPDPRRSTAKLPLIYGDLTVGGEKGLWQAVSLDRENFVFALAGHALLPLASGNEVTLFDKDGNEIDPAGYTLNLDHDYQGLGSIATVTFTEDPDDLDHITIRAKGKADDTGALMQNPVEIARDLLLSNAGASDDDLEAASFSRAAARADALNFSAGGVVERQSKAGDLLTAVMGEFMASWWKNADGRIKLVMDLGPGSLVESEIVHVFKPEHLKSIQVEADLEDLVNSVSISYAHNPEEDEFEAALDEGEIQDRKSIGLFGLQTVELELEWVRSGASARAVGQRLLDLAASPGRTVSFEEDALTGLHLEKGDAVIYSLPWLCDQQGRPLKNQIARVLSIEPQLDKGSVRYSLLDAGCSRTLAQLADGSLAAEGLAKGGSTRDRREY